MLSKNMLVLCAIPTTNISAQAKNLFTSKELLENFHVEGFVSIISTVNEDTRSVRLNKVESYSAMVITFLEVGSRIVMHFAGRLQKQDSRRQDRYRTSRYNC